MPLDSDKQRKLMFATMGGADTGVPKSVAKEFIKETPKGQFKKIKAQLAKGNK